MCSGLFVSASANALEHPFLGSLGEASKPSFEEAQGVAVDQATGDLLVLDREAGTLSRWHADGTAAKFSALGTNVIDKLNFGLAAAKNPGEVQVAVDNSCALHEPPLSELTSPTCAELDPANGNIYVATIGAKAIEIFDENGTLLGQLTEYNDGSAKAITPCGVAVDPAGNVYVGDFPFGVHKYEPVANPPVNADNSNNFPLAQNCNVAAGAGPVDGFIFPVHFNGAVAKLDGSTGAQKYVVDPSATTTATVNPETGTLFTAVGSEVREFDVSGETEAIPGLPIAPGGEKVGGVAVDAQSGNIYVSRKGNPNIEVWGPAAQLPKATTEEATVANGTVTLHGVVNANEGTPATCEFQFVEVSADGFEGATSVPCTPSGPFTGNVNEAVSAQISGLSEAAFRFRLVGKNEEGSKAGETLLFSTFAEVALPDGRAYEMVSPPQKAGEVIPPEPETQLGGSCGDCLPGENFAVAPMQSTAEGNSVLYLGQPFSEGLSAGANEYIAPRSSSGWGIETLSTPQFASGSGQGYQAFADDLSRAVLRQSQPTLSPQAPTRGGKGFENLYLVGGGALTPLITSEPPNRDTGNFRVQFGGANAGSPLVPPFSHLAFEADDALTEEVPGIAPAAPEVGAGECTLGEAECNLYEWSDGELRLVNVLPDESAAGNSVIGAGRLLAGGGTPKLEATNISHAISDDGSRIFWSSEETGQVYVRVNGEETLEVPGPGSCKKSVLEGERACFLTASADGSRVLLSNGTLYELNGAGTAYEESADLTEEESGFQGILGAAEDLSRIYFVDTAALSDQENVNEEEAEGGKLNLYSWDEGELTFIGKLATGDKAFGTRSYGTWAASPSQRTAQVSPDGSWLAFMSLARLTGYDNNLRGGGNCNSSGTACREVFVYSAEEEELSCASCNPTGQQPLGPANLSLIRPDAPFRQPANLSPQGEGRVFFESQDTLVSRDVNGRIQDVYEWEPQGIGSCERAGGCVYLISSGNSANDSMFMDSSEDGANAFFITREQLLRRDKNQQLDLYDARIGGGFEEPDEGGCSPEACAGPIAPAPTQPSAASASFAGSGNPPTPKPKPKHCKKGFVKKHGKCVKKHKPKQKSGRQGR
jgi:outer membrane protein assembly factor BamB